MWRRMYSPNLLFALVLFYKITANTELANTDPLLLGEIHRILQASGHSTLFKDTYLGLPWWLSG